MIRLTCPALLKGHPFVAPNNIEVMPTDRVDVGIFDNSSYTHIAFEAICSPDDQDAFVTSMLEQMRCVAQRWERHYESVSGALIRQ